MRVPWREKQRGNPGLTDTIPLGLDRRQNGVAGKISLPAITPPDMRVPIGNKAVQRQIYESAPSRRARGGGLNSELGTGSAMEFSSPRQAASPSGDHDCGSKGE